jgi:hypothetical protein
MDHNYDDYATYDLQNLMTEKILRHLIDLNLNFKYVGNVISLKV